MASSSVCRPHTPPCRVEEEEDTALLSPFRSISSGPSLDEVPAQVFNGSGLACGSLSPPAVTPQHPAFLLLRCGHQGVEPLSSAAPCASSPAPAPAPSPSSSPFSSSEPTTTPASFSSVATNVSARSRRAAAQKRARSPAPSPELDAAEAQSTLPPIAKRSRASPAATSVSTPSPPLAVYPAGSPSGSPALSSSPSPLSSLPASSLSSSPSPSPSPPSAFLLANLSQFDSDSHSPTTSAPGAGSRSRIPSGGSLVANDSRGEPVSVGVDAGVSTACDVSAASADGGVVSAPSAGSPPAKAKPADVDLDKRPTCPNDARLSSVCEGPFTETITCLISSEDTSDWVRTRCCAQPIDTHTFCRVWVGSSSPSCPFCRCPLPAFDDDATTAALADASAAARRLHGTLPSLYASHVFGRLLTHYSTGRTALRSAARKLALLVQLTDAQHDRLFSLRSRELKWFAITSAMCMFQNWMEVLPANASEKLLDRTYKWFSSSKLPQDSTLTHCLIVEAVRKAIHSAFQRHAHSGLFPLFSKPLAAAIYSRFLDIRKSASVSSSSSTAASAAVASLGGVRTNTLDERSVSSGSAASPPFPSASGAGGVRAGAGGPADVDVNVQAQREASDDSSPCTKPTSTSGSVVDAPALDASTVDEYSL